MRGVPLSHPPDPLFDTRFIDGLRSLVDARPAALARPRLLIDVGWHSVRLPPLQTERTARFFSLMFPSGRANESSINDAYFVYEAMISGVRAACFAPNLTFAPIRIHVRGNGRRIVVLFRPARSLALL